VRATTDRVAINDQRYDEVSTAANDDVSSSAYDVGQRQLHSSTQEEDNDSWNFPASVIVICVDCSIVCEGSELHNLNNL